MKNTLSNILFAFLVLCSQSLFAASYITQKIEQAPIGLFPSDLPIKISLRGEHIIRANTGSYSFSRNCVLKFPSSDEDRILENLKFEGTVNKHLSSLTKVVFDFDDERLDSLTVATGAEKPANLEDIVTDDKLRKKKKKGASVNLIPSGTDYTYSFTRSGELVRYSFIERLEEGGVIARRSGIELRNWTGKKITFTNYFDTWDSLLTEYIYVGKYNKSGHFISGTRYKVVDGWLPEKDYVGSFKDYKPHGQGVEYKNGKRKKKANYVDGVKQYKKF